MFGFKLTEKSRVWTAGAIITERYGLYGKVERWVVVHEGVDEKGDTFTIELDPRYKQTDDIESIMFHPNCRVIEEYS